MVGFNGLLLTESVNEGGSLSGAFVSFGQFILAVVVFAVVLYLAYVAARMLGKSRIPRKGSNFELIDSMTAGKDGAVQIIRAGKRVFMIGITKENISTLAEMNEDEITQNSASPAKIIPFEKYLTKVMGKFKKIN